MSAEIIARLARHGFNHEGTGGGCTALVRRDGDSEELITVSDPNEADAPTQLTDKITVGYYEDGDFLSATKEGSFTLADAIAALENPSNEYHMLSLRLENGLHKAVAR